LGPFRFSRQKPDWLERRLLISFDYPLANSLSNYPRTCHSRASIMEHILEERRNLFPQKHPKIGEALTDLGTTLFFQGKSSEAEPLLREAITIDKEIYPSNHVITRRDSMMYGLVQADLESQAKLNIARLDQIAELPVEDLD